MPPRRRWVYWTLVVTLVVASAVTLLVTARHVSIPVAGVGIAVVVALFVGSVTSINEPTTRTVLIVGVGSFAAEVIRLRCYPAARYNELAVHFQPQALVWLFSTIAILIQRWRRVGTG